MLALFFSVAAILAVAILAYQGVQRVYLPNQIRSARSLLAANRIEETLGLLRRLETRFRQNPEILWLKGQCESRQGHYLLAIVSLNDIIKNGVFTKDINETEVRKELARVYELGGRGREALTEYYLLTEREPEFYEGNLKIGLFHLDKKNFDEAEKFLKKAHLSNRKAIEPPLSLARICYQKRDILAGENYLSHILLNDPDHEEALFYTGLVCLQKKDLDGAMAFFQSVQKQDGPFRFQAMSKQAVCEISKGNEAQAYVLLESAIPSLPSRDESLKEALSEIIQIAVRMRRYKDLENYFDQFLKSFPNDTPMSSRKELFKYILRFPDLRDFFSGDNRAILTRSKELFERLEYHTEEVKSLSEDILWFKVYKTQKGVQKQFELFFVQVQGEQITKGQMLELTKWVKQEQVRALTIFTPFDFTPECYAYVKPMAVALFNGERTSGIIKGSITL